MQRIVHFDFKGAPLNIPYLEKVFLCIKSWGATGILIEWEDTFPYTSELMNFGSIRGCGGDGMYTYEEVQHIMKFAKSVELEVIQLIQTIGHMEFVLKHPQCARLRETSKSPAVLCPSKQDSFNLVCNLVKQVLDAQPDAKYIHIGADEVWHTAVCGDCQHKATNHQYKTASLYLDHIQNVVLFIKQQRPKLTVLMWDDMLRPIGVEILQAYNLGALIQPVIWNYSLAESFQIEPSLWVTYKKIFSKVWAGSAFKGANGSSQVLSPVTRYVSNQQAWSRQVAAEPGVAFLGVILTGWSRYDHYATLCELLPVSLPSLRSCLRVWETPVGSDTGSISEVLSDEQWPGIELARCVHSFVMLRDRCGALLHGDIVSTWLNPWHVERQYTSPAQLECIANISGALLTDVKGLHTESSVQLHRVTGVRSSEEWLHSFLTPLYNQIEQLHVTALKRLQAGPSVCPY